MKIYTKDNYMKTGLRCQNIRENAFYFLLIFFFILSKHLSFGQLSISNLNTTYTESFTGYVGTLASVPANWTINGNSTYNGINQTGGTTGGWYGNGNMSFLGSGSASNGNATWKLRNNTGSPITGFTVSFQAKMWRSQSNSPTVSLSYGTNTTGTVPGAGVLTSLLTFNDATTDIAAGTTLTQTISSISIPAGDYIYIRFTHAGGASSDNLGWDDVSIIFDGSCTAPTITSQPSLTSQTYCINQSGSVISLAATGTNLSYQWYSNNTASASNGTLIAGANSNSYTVPTNSANSNYFYCIVAGECGSPITSGISGQHTIFDIPNPPQGTINVLNQCGNVTLTHSSPNSNTFWQTSATGTSTTNPTTSDYISNTAGNVYIRTFNGNCWQTTTISQNYTITVAPSISTQPSNQTASYGSTATFSATGTNVNTWQWQVSSDNGATWTTIAGATNNTYTTSAVTASMNGYQYRVVANGNTNCPSITSNIAILTTQEGPCLEQLNFTSTPAGWTATSATYASNELKFESNNGSITTISISNPTSLSFSLRRTSNTSAKTLNVAVSTDGITFTTIATYTHANTTSAGTITANVDLSAYTNQSTVYIRLSKVSSTTSPWYIKNLTVNCQNMIVVPCTHTFSSFSPQNGSTGTEITINGTGFTSNTSVTIDGIVANQITFISSTKLKVIIPSGITAGVIVVTENDCDVTSITNFNLLTTSGVCTTNPQFTDLFISEVFDSNSNNGWYIELYNPTNQPINLATQNYQIHRYGDDTQTSPTRSINLTGIVPPQSVFTLNLGETQSCNSLAFDFTQSGAGINESDRIYLVKNGTNVDMVRTPNETGYTIIRNENASAPTTNYIASNWNLSSTESCADIGQFNLTTISSLPTIIIEPTNANACGATFDVTAVAGNSGVLSYQWFYQNNNGGVWTPVSATSPSNLTITGFNTPSLSITNGTATTETIDSFQFYCHVSEDASCSIYSKTVKFVFEAQRYYRSKVSGLWNTATTWETADSEAGPWSDACTYPFDTNSDYISIENNHTVTLPIDLSADQIIVQNQGTLILNEKLTVPNGYPTQEDLKVLGTLIDNGDITNGVAFTNGATWTLGNQATIVKTWSSSVLEYKNNYDGGISTIPATAKWYYRYVGNDNVVTLTEGMYYPNLYFESSTGFHAWDAANEYLNGSMATAIVKGNLSIGSTNTGTVEVFHNNTFANPILVYGNVYVGTGSTIRNNSLGSGNGTGFEIKGDSILINGTYNIDNQSTGKTIFSGTNLQHLVSTSNGTFHTAHATLNNANGLRLNGIDKNISQSLTFTDGIIFTNIAQVDKVNITNNSTAAIINGSAQNATNRYIDGKLQWNLNQGSIYTFPVGSNKAIYGAQGFKLTVAQGNGAVLAYLEPNTSAPLLNYAYCDIETHPGAGYVNIGNGLAGYDGIYDQILFNLHSPLQWNITNPIGAITQYDLTVLATGNQDIYPIVSANNLPIRYLMKNGQPGNPTVATITPTVDFIQLGFDACPNQYTLTDLTGFSLFTLDGATQGGTQLPIELVTFTGQLIDGNTGLLKWTTAAEINNDYFTLKHSLDGINFTTIAVVDGAGNSASIHHYTEKDFHLREGIHYYQLLSTNFDGTTYNRGIVALNVGFEKMYYNTITQAIEFSTESNYEIYSTEGKLVAMASNSVSLPFHHTGLFLIRNTITGKTQKLVIP